MRPSHTLTRPSPTAAQLANQVLAVTISSRNTSTSSFNSSSHALPPPSRSIPSSSHTSQSITTDTLSSSSGISKYNRAYF